MIENSTDIIAAIDGDGRLKDANPAAERILGWTRGSQTGHVMLDLVHPDDVAKAKAFLAHVLAEAITPQTVRVRLSTPDGSWVALEVSAKNCLNDPLIRAVVINARDVTDAEAQLEELSATRDGVVRALATAVEFRDPYTAGHQSNVRQTAVAICRELGVPEGESRGIEIAAALHDIGKMACPAEILSKPGKLTAAEFEIVKGHSQVGHDILVGAGLPWPVAEMILQHHERLDGSGYPHGLTWRQIPLGSRVIAVADVADAMTALRPYRAALGSAAAAEELIRNAGILYDPAVVTAWRQIAEGR
jgi:PAS domain S-box-containing protein/putative nucleotidyltransferase with HDIG domain